MGLFITASMNRELARNRVFNLTCQQMENSHKLEEIGAKLSQYTSNYTDVQLQRNATYQELVRFQAEYDTLNAALATEITLAEQEVRSYESTMQKDLEENKFWCFK